MSLVADGKTRSGPVAPPLPAAGRAVNLLSPWVLQELQVHRLRKRLVQALLALLVLSAGAWGFQQLQLSAARSDLEGEVAAGDGLRLQIDALAPVTSYVSAVRRRADAVRDTMTTQVDQDGTLRALDDALPQDATLDAFSFTVPGAGESEQDAAAPPVDLEATRGIVASCPGPDPFGTVPVIACLTVGGTAPDRATVAELVRRLGADPLFVEPFIDTTTTADGVVTFSGSVGLSTAAFTSGYDDVAPAPEEAR